MPVNLRDIPVNVIAEVSKVVFGKDEAKKMLLVALLAKGHVLIEGAPGTAKTTIARTFAQAIGGSFKRVQGTPDMLPSDITGFNLYRPDGSSTFIPGPIFANVVLADELNRTTTRTQSALLESMQEHQVTIEGITHQLESPFIVIASQVPYGGVGTSPFSDVQSDRFMLRVWSGLPSPEEESKVLRDIDRITDARINPQATTEEILKLQEEVKKVTVAENVRNYIIAIIDRLRHNADLSVFPSPRASISLFRGARSLAYLDGREFVIPDDVKRLALPCLSHRIHLLPESEMQNKTTETVIKSVLESLPVPK